MASEPGVGAAGRWRVVSVAVRVRDGPDRLAQAYRILWDTDRPHAARRRPADEEQRDGDRGLRAGLD